MMCIFFKNNIREKLLKKVNIFLFFAIISQEERMRQGV